MNVLVACEESQTVTKAFRAKGHEAFSCDIISCSGGHPEWHLQQDVTELLQQDWDLLIAHPPCTYLSVVQNIWFKEKYRERFPNRPQQREDAVEFFNLFVNAPIPKKAIENPIGIMSTRYRKADQIISPHYFGDRLSKRTCLWLTNLSPLIYDKSKINPNPVPFQIWELEIRSKDAAFGGELGKRARSKTSDFIANAMAEQWG